MTRIHLSKIRGLALVVPADPHGDRIGARLWRDRRAATAIEFAMVAAPFFALMLAVLQITLTFLAQQTLETASDKAVRQLLTGSAQQAGMTKEQFKTLVCSKLPAYMKCGNVMVDVRTATNFSSVNIATPTITFDSSGNPTNAWEYSPGNGGQITVARIMYIWKVQAGPLGFDIATLGGGRRLLTAVNVFQTESYS